MKTTKYIFYGAYLMCPFCGGKGKYRLWHYNTNPPTPIADPECGACFKTSCSHYNYLPSDYFSDHPEAREAEPQGDWEPIPDLPVTYISDKYLKWNIAKPPYYAKLLIWMGKRFSATDIQRSVDLYLIGQRTNGNILWPQIDVCGHIREIKLQNHNIQDGHRTSNYTLHAELVKSGLLDDSRSKQCLFGEHLLKLFPDKPVAIVESEKTALFFSMLMPERVWLATGGSNFLGKVRVIAEHLRGKSVTVYPDSGEYAEWSSKLKKYGIKCKVSDICESYPHNVDILDIYMHERFGDPIQSKDDATVIVPTLADNLSLARQMLRSSDTIERCKALIFLGTYTAAMKDVENWKY